MNVEVNHPNLSVNFGAERVYPELEDLEVTPSLQKQTFKSDMYGYNLVNVNAIESEELTVTPTSEKQVFEGLYNKVTCEKAEASGDITLPTEIPLNVGENLELVVGGNNKILLLDDKTILINVANTNNLNINKSNLNILNYIQFTGTQYINTGISVFAYSNYIIEMDVEITSFFDYGAVVGTVNGTKAYESWTDASGNINFRDSDRSIKTNAFSLNQKINLKLVKDNTGYMKILIDNIQKVAQTCSSNTLNSTVTLFHRPTTTYYGKAKLYRCKLYAGTTNTLLADYIPVLDQNNKPCLYNTVSKTYKYNAGTGEFLYG